MVDYDFPVSTPVPRCCVNLIYDCESRLRLLQSTPGASVVATGSDDGYVGVWDSRVKDAAAGANLVLLRPAHAQGGDGKDGSPGGRGGKPDGAECVTSLEAS